MILQLHCFCAVLEQNIMVGGYRGTSLFISWSTEIREGKGPRMNASLENRFLSDPVPPARLSPTRTTSQ